MIEKIPHTIGNKIFPLKCGFAIGYDIGYGIGWKYRPIWVSVSVSDLNQNSGFSRILSISLEEDDMGIQVWISLIYFLYSSSACA